MAVYEITWKSLLNLTELEFKPERPRKLKMTDEVIQTISWLTGATPHDRRLLRCDDNGALLTADAWSNLASVEADELYPQPNVPDTYTAIKTNQGVLVATSTELILADFYRRDTADYERVYIPANELYFYPHKVFKVIVATVPYDTGTASYVGITAFD